MQNQSWLSPTGITRYVLSSITTSSNPFILQFIAMESARPQNWDYGLQEIGDFALLSCSSWERGELHTARGAPPNTCLQRRLCRFLSMHFSSPYFYSRESTLEIITEGECGTARNDVQTIGWKKHRSDTVSEQVFTPGRQERDCSPVWYVWRTTFAQRAIYFLFKENYSQKYLQYLLPCPIKWTSVRHR